MRKFVIIPCGGKKQEKAAPAAELYTGSMFKDQLRTALTMTDRKNVLILSALHGLVKLDAVLEPYDLKMGQKGTVNTDVITNQLADILPRDTTFVINALLPKAYAAKLEAAYPYWIENHYEGCAGIGYQKQRLAQIRKAA